MTTEQTLFEVFEPPGERLVAHSAVLVAMTGTRDFLEQAMIHFTGLKARQRAEQGITSAYLVLDAAKSDARPAVFAPHDIPGLLELQPRAVPVALLHAKLALLGYAPTRTAEEPTHLRLAVLTANFTYASARQQLELVWTVDVEVGKATASERADIAAGAKFVEELIARRYHLPEREEPRKKRPLTGRLDTLLRVCAELEPERANSGFIHSLDTRMYPQIKTQMKRLRGSATHNLMVCGSGFFEDAGAAVAKPKVLSELEKLGGMTDNARRVVIAEPKMAGAIAPWVRSGVDDDWVIFAPHDAHAGTGAPRSLHAKFIYTGWLRGEHASGGCLYLGSGNLSRRGLFSAGAEATGRAPVGHEGVNIECGVVLAVDERLSPEDLAKRLFWHADEEVEHFDEWEEGSSLDEQAFEPIVASPVLVARAEPGGTLHLEWRDDTAGEAFEVWDGQAWVPLMNQQPVLAVGADVRLDTIRIRSAASHHEWSVPVVDEIGRTCWSRPVFATYEEALAALLDFPIRVVEEGDEDDDSPEDPEETEGASETTATDELAKGYALHAAAEMLEQTAALQRALGANMLDDWLDHLERTLRSSFPPALIETWRSHRIDVFTHLAAPAFRPEAFTGKQRARYEAILDGVARDWRVR